MSMDADEFRRASRAVWDAMAAGWDARHAYFESVARPVTETMLDRLSPTRGQVILDLAAGTGVCGFAAADRVGPEGRVIVSDFSEAMVDAARRQAARLALRNVDCRVLDAEALELPDDSVDGVVCRWGFMLMADPAAALAETRRVLRAGGRLAFAVFAAPAQNPWGAIPVRVLVEGGHLPPPETGAPGLFALANDERLRTLVRAAGFSEPSVDEVAFTWRFANPDAYWDFLTEAAGAVAIVLDKLDDEERSRIGDRIRERVAAFEQNGLELPALSLVVAAE